MKLAIVILNWNGEQMLRQFLPKVVTTAKTVEASVYVVDNASTDQSLAYLTTLPTIQTIALDDNYGFAEGYNRGLKEIDAIYYLLLNSDVEVTDNWLFPLLHYMEQHPEVAACQPKIKSFFNRSYFEHAGACGGFLDKYGYPFCRGRVLDYVEQDNGQYDSIVSVFWASGAALFIRAVDYWQVDGLDGRFFAHMEEIDLCWRLRSRDRSIACVPQSVVYHMGGGTLPTTSYRKVYLNFRNNLLMLYKNLPENELRHIMNIRFVLDHIAVFQFLVKGQFSFAKAVWQARSDYKKMRPLYHMIRQENLLHTLLTDIPERKKYSILWKYLRGKRDFL